MLPYLLAATLPSWLRCLQPASRSLELYASVPPRRDTYSAPPGALHTTTSLHLHRAFRPPYLQAYPLLHLQHASRAPKLSTILLCLHDYGASPTLHASTSLHEQRPSNAPTLHTSTLEEDDRRTCNVTPFASFTPRDPLLSALAKGCEQAMQTF